MRLIHALPAVVVLVACGAGNQGSPLTPLPTQREAFESKGPTAIRLQTEPDLTAWDPASRSNLRALSRQGVVAVHYEGEGDGAHLEVLSDCIGKRSYEYQAYVEHDTRVARSMTELAAQLPLAGADLKGKLGTGRSLRTDYRLVGLNVLPVDRPLARRDLVGVGCQRATHVVTRIYLGAFAMAAGATAELQAAVSVFGLGTQGAHSEVVERVASAGEPTACDSAVRDEKEHNNCAVPLRIALSPLPSVAPGATPPTVDEARAFLAAFDREVRPLQLASDRASWEAGADVSSGNDRAATEASGKLEEFVHTKIRESRRFDVLDLPAELAHQIDLLRRYQSPRPNDPAAAAQLKRVRQSMESSYGSAKACGAAGKCRDLAELQQVLKESRNLDELKAAWVGWHDTTTPIRALFGEYVRLSNEAARDFGAQDYGRYAKQSYDAVDFERDIDGVWRQLRPLYEQLHCYVRSKLHDKYGDAVPARGPIPAHVLGDMWAQNWSAIGDLLGLKGAAPAGPARLDANQIVRAAETYYTSMGFDPLPGSFWERSILTKPEGRSMICHASAWDVGLRGDLRLRACLSSTLANVVTAHHEMAHLYYFQSYGSLPILLQSGPDEAFHEGVAQAIELAMTPQYLHEIGASAAPAAGAEVASDTLLRRALDDVAFLPFALSVDKWRWNVLGGEISPQRYNASWWALRRQYQGIAPPAPRGETSFDPGAKYHIAADVTYIRYFVARVLSFQVHRALCRAAGENPATCSLYKNKKAGEKLRAMLALGASKPSAMALAAVGAEPRLDASAMLEYYAPLRARLDKELKGQTCGW